MRVSVFIAMSLLDSGTTTLHTFFMTTTYSITRAQHDFPRLVRESADTEAIAITRHDETVAYVISRERMDAVLETMEVLANPKAMREIRAYERGKMPFQPLDVLNDEG